jgi:ABC-type Mn2+/Zn2+ transport system ATPase subunit
MTLMSTETAIKVTGLSVSYDRKRVLSNIYVEIPTGTVVGVIGPNGAGKSTLFKAILGLIEPNAGKVEIFGKPVNEGREDIAYVPQRDDVDWQFPATVMDIVTLGRYPHKKWYQRIDAKDLALAVDALNALGIPELKGRQIGELSGGQQQRVFIARSLCQGAEIFLLDEPFVGVDMTTEQKIIEILKKLASEGKTMLVVHHDLSTVEQYFDYTIMLNQRLVAAGPTQSTFTKENIAAAYGPQLTILHKTGAL